MELAPLEFTFWAKFRPNPSKNEKFQNFKRYMSLKQKMQINLLADFRNNMSYSLRAQNFVMIEEKTMKLEGGGGGGGREEDPML